MIDPEKVGALVREVGREEVWSRFRLLKGDQIRSKASFDDPSDIVTDADLAAEARLTSALRAWVPGSIVIGEEAAAADPGLLEAVTTRGPVWVVDPLDGTANFAAGREAFGTMVALAVDGEVRWSWIYLPAQDALFVAAAGGGASLNGASIHVPVKAVDAAARGTVYTRFMPAALREQVERRAAPLALVPGPGCACIEYTTLARGAKDFAVYHRLLPWDHAPGLLLLREAGGAGALVDGAPYALGVTEGPLLLTRSPEAWEPLARRLFGTQPS